jgi:arylsulfatase A-like enzyme
MKACQQVETESGVSASRLWPSVRSRSGRVIALWLLLFGRGFTAGDASAEAVDRRIQSALPAAAPVPPNVIVIVIDDLGWTDLGSYGSRLYETPNVDRLASEGTRLTAFYTASPVCSPTRASLMTGRHPARLRITNWIGGEQKGMLLQAEYGRQLPLEALTVGEAFRQAGYVTGYIGKWHLGAEGYLPDAQGFDEKIAVNLAGQPASYFHPYARDDWPATNVPDLADGRQGDYLTERLTEKALGFLDRHRSQPFLLVLSHYAVHTPIQAREKVADRYRAKLADDRAGGGGAGYETEGRAIRPGTGVATTKLGQDHAEYAAMVESVDRSVGAILGWLDDNDLAEGTLVVFVSDNGGLSTLAGDRTSAPTSNTPLRAGKGWLYEGGIRVPFVIRWTGVVQAGREIPDPAMTTDLFPTLLDLAGLPLQPAHHVDGISLGPLLRGSEFGEDRALFWHFPHYHGSGNRPSGAIRSGDFKLVEWFEDGRVELYDLASDPGEEDDLARRMPARTDQLRRALHRWRTRVGALLPIPNPDWEGPSPER